MNSSQCVIPAIAVLAGRRIDALDTKNLRFPLAEAEYVTNKIVRKFRHEHIKRLVCSAACGADILALEAAEKLSIPAIIVLPFTPKIFRKISVTDRPGKWGELFDRLVEAARDRDDLVELGLDVNDTNAFSEANRRIIHSALSLQYQRKIAFVVWEGRSRGDNDSTAEFLNMALSKGFEKRSVSTRRRDS